jgi:hypothetical protein
VNIEYDETNGYLYFVGNSQKDKWGGWKRIPSITKINASNGDIEWTRSIYPWNMFGSNRLTTGDTRIRDMKLSDDHVYGIATTGEENMYGRSWVNGSGGNFEAKRERTFVFRMPKDGSGAVAYDSSTNYTNWVYHTNAVDVAVMSNTNNSAYNSWSEAGSWPRIGHNESNGGAQGFSNVTNGNWDTYVGTSQSDMWHDQNWTTAALTAQNGTKTHELIKLE